MNKELEALERLNENWRNPLFFEMPLGDYYLIKSALEHKEKLEKAWDIIKRLCKHYIGINIILEFINLYDNFKDFSFRLYGDNECPINEDEFNLLKKCWGKSTKIIEECVPATDKDGLSYCYSIYQEDDGSYHLEREYNFSNNCEGEPTYYDDYFDTLDEVYQFLKNN